MLNLLWIVAVFFVLLWVLGFTFHVTLGGVLHVLLVLALISIIVRLVAGRRSA